MGSNNAGAQLPLDGPLRFPIIPGLSLDQEETRNTLKHAHTAGRASYVETYHWNPGMFYARRGGMESVERTLVRNGKK